MIIIITDNKTHHNDLNNDNHTFFFFAECILHPKDSGGAGIIHGMRIYTTLITVVQVEPQNVISPRDNHVADILTSSSRQSKKSSLPVRMS